MSLFGRKRPPELERVAEARRRIREQGDPRPVVLHTLDKVEAAIEVALDDRQRVRESLDGFDATRIGAELKAALRAKPRPDAPDDATIVSLRKRHEAVHALQNRAEEIESGIQKALVDIETLVAQAAMSNVLDDGTLDDLGHWLELLDADARALTDAHAVVDRMTPNALEDR